MKILNKKKYNDYTKRVYIDIREPETQSFHLKSHNMLDTVFNNMTFEEDKEKPLLIAHCVKHYVLLVVQVVIKTKMTKCIKLECVIPVGKMYLQYPTSSLRMFEPIVFEDVQDSLRVFQDYI